MCIGRIKKAARTKHHSYLCHACLQAVRSKEGLGFCGFVITDFDGLSFNDGDTREKVRSTQEHMHTWHHLHAYQQTWCHLP
jgi:hypothetical protein